MGALLLLACHPTQVVQKKPASLPITIRATIDTIATADDLPTGTNATAKIGDWRLRNENAEFVIDQLGDKQGFAASGGNLIDARLKGGVDAINQTFLYLDETFPRQAQWEKATPSALPDGSVELLVEGRDTNDASLALRSVYRLSSHGAVLHIATTVQNTGTAAVLQYELGDCMQWGKTEHYAPGVGTDMHSKRLELDWVVGVGDGVSYGMFSKHGPMSSISGTSWTDLVHKRVDLQPGDSATFERDFVVGNGDVTSVLAASGHVQTSVVSGYIKQSNGKPVTGGELLFSKGDLPFAMTYAYPGGYFEAALPNGTYDVIIAGTGLRSRQRVSLVVKNDMKQDFTVESGGTVRFAVSEGGKPTPAKVSFYGVHETRNPVLGKAYVAAGAGNVALTIDGKGEVKLPRGRYQVFASRGIEYDVAEREIELASDGDVEIAFELHHVLNTDSYLSGDFHQHQRNSFDSAVSLEDRALTNLAEGLDVMVPTDHDFVTDMAPIIAKMGVQDQLLSLSAVEATTHNFGHYGAYPVTPKPGAPRNGAPETYRRTPAQIMADLRAAEPADKIIQVNHPRAEMTGFFELTHFDSEKQQGDENFAFDFDVIEVFNGKRIKEAEKVMLDWMRLMAAGKRFTATGNSDSHQVIYQEVGYPRNFVRIARDGFSPQGFVDAMKKQRAVIVTNGPFVEIFAGKAQVGDTVKVKGGDVEVRFKVQAAPWVDVRQIELWQDGKAVFKQAIPESKEVLRLEGKAKLKVAKSSYVFAIVRGEKPLEPVLPTQRNKPTLPFGFTNPIFFDK